MDTSPASRPSQLTVRELADRLQRGDDLVLIDVRESSELAIASFPRAIHVPLAMIPLRLAEIPRDRPVVLACHHGNRSGLAQQFLRAQGYTDVINLKGGIDAWSREVDPGVARY